MSPLDLIVAACAGLLILVIYLAVLITTGLLRRRP